MMDANLEGHFRDSFNQVNQSGSELQILKLPELFRNLYNQKHFTCDTITYLLGMFKRCPRTREKLNNHQTSST